MQYSIWFEAEKITLFIWKKNLECNDDINEQVFSFLVFVWTINS